MKEKLSAWMDGELNQPQSSEILPQVECNAELRAEWDCYHLIGDALRGSQGPDLCAKIRARLDAEPTVLAPQRRGAAQKLPARLLSLVASVAAVAFVGWMALSGPGQVAPQLAANTAVPPKTVAVAAGEGAKDYLIAHQRYSPSSAMQGVAPYVRTVADEHSAARR